MTQLYQTFESYKPEETEEIAGKIANEVSPGTCILLEGDLGAGKTVFTKGFGRALGIRENIVSPTFTILKIYRGGKMPLYHFDLYRIEDSDELFEIGFDEYLSGDGITMIEWPCRAENDWPEKSIRVEIQKDPKKGDDYRKIVIGEV